MLRPLLEEGSLNTVSKELNSDLMLCVRFPGVTRRAGVVNAI